MIYITKKKSHPLKAKQTFYSERAWRMGCLDGWNVLGGTKGILWGITGIMIWNGLDWAGLGWGAFRLLFSINEITAIIEQGEWRKD